MNYQNISEIYAANDQIRQRLIKKIGNLTDADAAQLPKGEKWTIAQIVEHLSIVEDGMTKICAKLLAEAQKENKQSDGAARISGDFIKGVTAIANQKLEAPERVRPTGTQTIAESLQKVKENRDRLNDLRPLFETVECSEQKFPHPFLGALTAHEWLIMLGGHEARHVKQIENILEKIEQNSV